MISTKSLEYFVISKFSAKTADAFCKPCHTFKNHFPYFFKTKSKDFNISPFCFIFRKSSSWDTAQKICRTVISGKERNLNERMVEFKISILFQNCACILAKFNTFSISSTRRANPFYKIRIRIFKTQLHLQRMFNPGKCSKSTRHFRRRQETNKKIRLFSPSCLQGPVPGPTSCKARTSPPLGCAP